MRARATHGILFTTIVLLAAGVMAGGQRSGRPSGPGQPVDSNTRDQNRRHRFTPDSGTVDDEDGQPNGPVEEAPSGFDNQTNGFDPQGPDFAAMREAVALRSFNDNRFIFEEIENAADGLGPTYNAQSCRECHQNVVTGGASQVTEQRTGHLSGGDFFESLGGSLIQSRATDPDAVELVAVGDSVRTFRISTNTLGLGFVEAVANKTLLGLRDDQPPAMRGTAVIVPVPKRTAAPVSAGSGGRAQHASLESFSADAYLNEMGVTSPLLSDENTISGQDASAYDPVADPEDDGDDVKAFANFMRATKAPSRGPITAQVSAGEQVFTRTGCAICHVASMTTAPRGTRVRRQPISPSRASAT